MSVTMKLETITPVKAAKYLERNRNNRAVKAGNVRRIQGALTDGVWKLNGETLKFDTDSNLIDGQHRLLAVVQSGLNLQTYVVRGLPPAVAPSLDQLTPRSVSDNLAMSGEKNPHEVAAVTKAVWCHEEKFAYRSRKPRPDQAIATLAANPGIRDAVVFVRKLRQSIMNPTDAMFMVYLTRQTFGANVADPFWVSVLTGESITKGMPAFALHQRLFKSRISAAKLPPMHQAALCVKAFRMHLAGKRCRHVRWCPDTEAFPLLVQAS